MRGFGELGPAKKSDPQSVTGMFWCRCEIEGTPDTLRHIAVFRSEGAFHVAIATLKLIGDGEEELTSRKGLLNMSRPRPPSAQYGSGSTLWYPYWLVRTGNGQPFPFQGL